MNTTQFDALNRAQLVASALGILALLLIVAVLTNTKISFITGDRDAFMALAIIGFFMCARGSTSRSKVFGWLTPVNIVGIILGVINTLLILGVLTSSDMPLISNDREAFIALALIMVIKYSLAMLAWLGRSLRGARQVA